MTLTVFGDKAASDPIPLGAPDTGKFESGSRNEFDVSCINVFENFCNKLRIFKAIYL